MLLRRKMAMAVRIAKCRLPGWLFRVALLLGATAVESDLWAQPGRLDPSFNPGTGADQTVYSLAPRPDGRILIGGSFSAFNGISRTNIARLNPDGSGDTNFVPGSALGESLNVSAVALQADGKVLLGGVFTSASGTNLIRLNTNGTVDPGFSAQTDSGVNSLALQTNGHLVVGGYFTTVNGAAHTAVAQLGTNGVLDAGFNPNLAGGTLSVYAVVVQSNGKIVIGGSFTSVNSTPTTNLARLNVDGTLDSNFKPVSFAGLSAVNAVAVDGQGKVLAGGDFASVNGVTRTNLVRFNSDGSLDANFNPAAGTDATVFSIAVQHDGKVLVGGLFTIANGINRNYIARLNADGSLDTSFDPGSGANYIVYSLAEQSD